AMLSGDPDQRYKWLQYEFDLISGNVHEVNYQPGKADQYHHRYGYDDDNRITKAETSRDGIFYKTDARYEYYLHGPLSRMELGQNQVQGVDYAYTLEGWLKGVNGDHFTSSPGQSDMGKDGWGPTGLNRTFGRDAYGFSLDYYDAAANTPTSEYTPIGTDVRASTGRPFSSTEGAFTDFGRGLFNGNIKHMVSCLPDLPGQTPSNYLKGSLATVYHYDQLNRITGMRA